jgi:CHAT domain-containing protein
LRIHHQRSWKTLIRLVLLIALLAPITCRIAASPEERLTQNQLLFQHGDLEASQTIAASLANRYRDSNPAIASQFLLLEAKSAAWRGLSDEILATLSAELPFSDDPQLEIERRSLLGLAHSHLSQYDQADQEFGKGAALCADAASAACGELQGARAGDAIRRGHLDVAYQLFLETLASAKHFKQPLDEATALMNLGYACLLQERFDEAIDWSRKASKLATGLQAEDVLLTISGNLGWAYYKLGDSEKALNLFQDAEQRAIRMGDSYDAIAWLTDEGRVYQDNGSIAQAAQAYKDSLQVARQIHSNEDILNSLENLLHISVQAGKLQDTQFYLDQLSPLLKTGGNRLDSLDVMLAQGEIAALQNEGDKAEEFFREVEHDPASQTSMRLGAEHQLARLYESRAQLPAAQAMYRTALATFEAARQQLSQEDSKLPFLANATGIYDDYIQFLIHQGKVEEALITADQSRARTLAQGMGSVSGSTSKTFSPGVVSAKADSTLLFYWLGEKQSYLWAVTPAKTSLFTLPPQGQIAPLLERYRNELLGTQDPLKSASGTGQQLYQILVAPATGLLYPNAPVMILADGPLSLLNFETLIVPARAAGPPVHYWIEDATVIAAPSLSMLTSTATAHRRAGNSRLLLVGDAVSAEDDYPELPFAAQEMQLVGAHFPEPEKVVFNRLQATPAAYLSSDPKRFSYIHFVSHGVASRTDPLDSAIILSRGASKAPSADPGPPVESQGSFKLYAREVMQHPIDAEVVTISACYGSGTRAYAGEGLVGLSWAFLRAGAHSAVGALWEVSDRSTPMLMNSFYQGLREGQSPSSALRQAKLTLLRSTGNFRKPFYWASFQIYTRTGTRR